MRMRVSDMIRLVIFFLSLGLSYSFAPTSPVLTPLKPTIPRGGGMDSLSSLPIAAIGDMASVISSSLQSGPFGVLGLSAVISSVALPLTLYKKIYGISVAYGFSVFAACLTLFNLFPMDPASSASLLVKACMFYGMRLGGFLLLRDMTRKHTSSINNGSIMSRVIFSLSVSLFYAFLTTPALYALRGPSSSLISLAGANLAWFGAILEGVADAQKYLVKRANPGVEEFVGPTSLAYQVSRHPNYLGEILFWTGSYMAGAPSFGTSIPAWVCSTLGLYGIVSIMLKATSGLEKKQSEKYSGQEKYDKWKKQVKSPLFPLIQ
jgi:steroid 5-alpha reductase family enzyme